MSQLEMDEQRRELVDAIYRTLRDVSLVPVAGSLSTLERNQGLFDGTVEKYHLTKFNEAMSDDEVWQTIHVMPFYAGVAPPKPDRISRAKEALADYRVIAQPGWIDSAESQAYIADSESYWNELASKGPRIIEAAQKLHDRQQRRKMPLIDLLVPKRYRDWSKSSLQNIWVNMRSEVGFGRITTYHAMMELGVPVVKPDRMLVRTIARLGLMPTYGEPTSRHGRREVPASINSQEALALGVEQSFVWDLQPLMADLASASSRSMREVDWLFAKMGMQKAEDEGRELVICDEVPLCKICRAHPFCTFGQSRYQPAAASVSKKAKKSKSRRIRKINEQPGSEDAR